MSIWRMPADEGRRPSTQFRTTRSDSDSPICRILIRFYRRLRSVPIESAGSPRLRSNRRHSDLHSCPCQCPESGWNAVSGGRTAAYSSTEQFNTPDGRRVVQSNDLEPASHSGFQPCRRFPQGTLSSSRNSVKILVKLHIHALRGIWLTISMRSCECRQLPHRNARRRGRVSRHVSVDRFSRVDSEDPERPNHTVPIEQSDALRHGIPS